MDARISVKPKMIKLSEKKRKTNIITALIIEKGSISHKKGYQNVLGIIRAGLGYKIEKI